MQLIRTAEDAALAKPLRIVFPDACDARMLQAANELKLRGLARPILIGNPFELRHLAHQSRISLPSITALMPESAGCFDTMVEKYQEKQRKPITKEEAECALRNPLYFAMMMVKEGYADLCIAGNLSTTGDVIRAALKGVGIAKGNKTVSSFFMMISPDGQKEYAFSDAGVIPEPTTEQLADIAISTADNFESITKKKAKVAMLSFSTKGSANHPSATSVKDAVDIVKEKRPDMIIDGEMQFDAAIDESVAGKKMPDSTLKGDANVFIFPSLNAGNISYKVAQRLGGFVALGPMLQGLSYPVHDLSRGCSVNDIINLSVLTSYMRINQLKK